MNSEILKALFALQSRSKGHEFVFVNPKTKTRIKEVKKGFGNRHETGGDFRTCLA